MSGLVTISVLCIGLGVMLFSLRISLAFPGRDRCKTETSTGHPAADVVVATYARANEAWAIRVAARKAVSK
jgi:hypothetical protein